MKSSHSNPLFTRVIQTSGEAASSHHALRPQPRPMLLFQD
jgi:hypothetical protein